ncbi:MAG: InlB B-repeat-containing protein [Bacilli bacterium]|nr:InlB B-repeat-containing protein [Bacilli bacterium]
MNKKGFTLIEIIAVIIILGILLIITIPLVQKYITNSGKASMASTASAYVETVKAEYEMGEYGSFLDDEEIMIVPLEYIELEQGDTEKSKFASYDKDKSYVVISPENNGYEFYINLVDDAGNGLVMKKTTDLIKENMEEDTLDAVTSWKLYDPDSTGDASSNVFTFNDVDYSCYEKRNISAEESLEISSSDCGSDRTGLNISKGVILLYADKSMPTCYIQISGGLYEKGVYYGDPVANIIATDSRGKIVEKGIKINDDNVEYNNAISVPLVVGNNHIYGFTKDDSGNVGVCEKKTIKADNQAITYHDNIGSSWSNQSVDVSCEGKTLTIVYGQPYNKNGELCTPSKSGYRFVGWSKSANGDAINSLDIVSEKSGVELYAKWDPNTFTIKLNANNGSNTTSEFTCNYDSTCKIPSTTFTRSGYKIIGWDETATDVIPSSSSYTPKYGTEADIKNIISDGEKTLYAVWKVDTVSVTFNSNGGTGTMSNFTCNMGESCTLPANTFTKTNYSFSGWATSASGSVVYQNNATVTLNSNTTLYAVWTLNTVKVTFNSNGGTGTMSNFTCNMGASCTLPANTFTKTNYSFNGWATSASGSAVYQNNAAVTLNSDTTLYAVWKINTVKVTFNANGGTGSMSTLTCNMGASCTLTANSFTKSGYAFAGWAKSASGAVAYRNKASATLTANTTLYAIWGSTTPKVFYYTGASQTFKPTYTGDYKIELWGAQGGKGREDGNYTPGGRGNKITATLELTGGTNYYVYVGGAGGIGGYTADKKNVVKFVGKTDVCNEKFHSPGGLGGWNGGGAGGKDCSGGDPEPDWDEPEYYKHDAGGGGGGATDIRTSSATSSRILVAGGGGGAVGWDTAYSNPDVLSNSKIAYNSQAATHTSTYKGQDGLFGGECGLGGGGGGYYGGVSAANNSGHNCGDYSYNGTNYYPSNAKNVKEEFRMWGCNVKITSGSERIRWGGNCTSTYGCARSSNNKCPVYDGLARITFVGG